MGSTACAAGDEACFVYKKYTAVGTVTEYKAGCYTGTLATCTSTYQALKDTHVLTTSNTYDFVCTVTPSGNTVASLTPASSSSSSLTTFFAITIAIMATL